MSAVTQNLGKMNEHHQMIESGVAQARVFALRPVVSAWRALIGIPELMLRDSFDR